MTWRRSVAVMVVSLAASVAWLPYAEAHVETLAEPARILRAEIYKDGGTVAIELEDANGQATWICLDRRAGQSTRPWGSLIVGVKHPNDPGGEVLARGGTEERQILTLLRASLDDFQEHSAGQPRGVHQVELVGRVIDALESRQEHGQQD